MAGAHELRVSSANTDIQMGLEALDEAGAAETLGLDCLGGTASLPSGFAAPLDVFQATVIGPQGHAAMEAAERGGIAREAADAPEMFADSQDPVGNVGCLAVRLS